MNVLDWLRLEVKGEGAHMMWALGLGPEYVSHVRRGSDRDQRRSGPHVGPEAGAHEPRPNPTPTRAWVLD